MAEEAYENVCYARWDKYPVTEGHLLVIPNRHIADYFSVTSDGHDHEHEHGIPGDRETPTIHAVACAV